MPQLKAEASCIRAAAFICMKFPVAKTSPNGKSLAGTRKKADSVVLRSGSCLLFVFFHSLSCCCFPSSCGFYVAADGEDQLTKVLMVSDWHRRHSDRDARPFHFDQCLARHEKDVRLVGFVGDTFDADTLDEFFVGMGRVLDVVNNRSALRRHNNKPDLARLVAWGNHDGADSGSIDRATRSSMTTWEAAHPGRTLTTQDALRGTDGLVDATHDGIRYLVFDTGNMRPAPYVSDTVTDESLARIGRRDMGKNDTGADCTVAVMHIPPPETDGLTSQTDANFIGHWYKWPTPVRTFTQYKGVWNALELAGVDIVVTGHWHCNRGMVQSPANSPIQWVSLGHFHDTPCQKMRPSPSVLSINRSTCRVQQYTECHLHGDSELETTSTNGRNYDIYNNVYVFRPVRIVDIALWLYLVSTIIPAAAYVFIISSCF